MTVAGPRRIAAIYAPELAPELLRQRLAKTKEEANRPMAIVLERNDEVLSGDSVVRFADESAKRYGIRVGQSVAEAAALVAHLSIGRIKPSEMIAALGQIAEVALAYGGPAALRLSAPTKADDEEVFDTVWLDITGTGHLFGDESLLVEELKEQIAALGHQVRVAVADGPRIAQALARWAQWDGSLGGQPWGRTIVIPPGQSERALSRLPLQALPMGEEALTFFLRSGIFQVGDLAKLPANAVAARLGTHAPLVLGLLRGYDLEPLVPYELPRFLADDMRFEEGVDNSEALLFVLRGMTNRLATRLAARGEACCRIELKLRYDASIARLNTPDVPNASDEPDESTLQEEIAIDVPKPLRLANDLWRTLKVKVDKFKLIAPIVECQLSASKVVRATAHQMNIQGNRDADPASMAILLAELTAELGADRLGQLALRNTHRPEERTVLVPFEQTETLNWDVTNEWDDDDIEAPTRTFAPLPLGLIKRAQGAVVVIDRRLYMVEKMEFTNRLDGVEWWTDNPMSRDYYRAWLVSGSAANKSICGQARIFVDRKSGESFLDGWYE